MPRTGPVLLLAALALFPSCGSRVAEVSSTPDAVLFVTIDTLRADRLGCYGYERAETPTLDALAARGVVFESCWSTAPLTLPSHTSLLTGTIPPYHGVRDNAAFSAVPELDSLPELLAAEGWRTAAYVAAFVLDSQYGLGQGFERYGNVPQRVVLGGDSVQQRSADEVNGEAIQWLESVYPGEPFFLWVHYFEPHRPYPEGAELPARFEGRPYDAEVATADRALGDLLDQLERMGRLENTLVVVTSDHGESLGEHGETTHSYFVYQGVLHVPLIFAHGSLEAGRRVDSWVSLVDVAPTVIELLELPARPLPPPARSLAAGMRGGVVEERAVYFESLTPWLSYGWAPLMGVGADGHKLIRAPRSELFELGSDPEEANNLFASSSETAEALGARLDALLAENSRPSSLSNAERKPSDEERAQLSALGYFQEDGSNGGSEHLDPKDGFPRIQARESAMILFEQGKPQAALAAIQAVLREEPDNAFFRSQAAAILIQLERFGEALPHVEASLEGGFYTADNAFNLGQCLLSLGRPDEALDAFRDALVLDEKHLASMLTSGQLLAQRGEKQAAREQLERFLELWSGDAAMTAQVRQLLAGL